MSTTPFSKASALSIIVDDREVSSGVLAYFQHDDNIDISIDRLAVGDYQVGDNLLFERKTLLDLVSSLKDGRLFRQGIRLANHHSRGVIILEGSSRELHSSAMRRDALQGALITLTVFFGLPLLRSMDLAESVRLMLFTARQQQTMAFGALARRAKRPGGRRSVQLYLIQGLPGIGPDRALKLLHRFGSVEAVFTASLDALEQVEGIGAETARMIRWSVG